VSFTHNITPQKAPLGSRCQGLVDHATIGRVLQYLASKRRFQVFLLIVVAEFANSVDQALPKLLVYLASLSLDCDKVEVMPLSMALL
jgi:hypothetical protein